MAATTVGTTGATFGITSAETGGLMQTLSSKGKIEKEVTKNHQGETVRVTYYDPTTEVSAEWVPTGITGISAVALATALTLTNTVRGTGLLYPEEIDETMTNTTERRMAFTGTKYPLITS
jgi:Na+/glutamate symporter